MIRRQIQLEEKQYEQLRSIGAREEKGLAEQVREAVTLYLARNPARPLPSLDEIAGRFHQLPPSALADLKPHDRCLSETNQSPEPK